MPKKGAFKKHDGSHLLNTLAKFIKSDYDVLVIEYNGERLNSIVGFLSDSAKRWQFMPHIFWLFKIWLQECMFSLVRHFSGGEIKNTVYRAFGMKVGKDVYIASEVYVDDFMPELITIDDGAIIGLRSTILTHEFTIKHGRFGRVHIGKQALIGAGSIVRSGVTVGEKAVVAMDSFVNKDIPPREEIGGVPEHEIRHLDNLI